MSDDNKFTRYSVILVAEDGAYVIRKGCLTHEAAAKHIESIQDEYGEGQELHIERYQLEWV